MIKIGLTGGIGSGKTTVARMFLALGFPVYFADERAKWLMNNSTEIRNKLITLFGENAYTRSGLNRRFLAKEVFSDKTQLEKLNSVVHPIVAQDFEEWCAQQTESIVLKEAALIFENNAQDKLDKTIVVSTTIDERVKRVLKRDPFRNENEVFAIIDKQLSEKEKVAKADFVLTNNSNDKLLPQIFSLITKLTFIDK